MSRVKGSPKTGGRKVGSKNKATLLKEERRSIFENEISQHWLETIKKLRPEYVADQFMGPVTQKLEHSGEVKTGTPIPAEALAIIEEDLRKKKLQDERED